MSKQKNKNAPSLSSLLEELNSQIKRDKFYKLNSSWNFRNLDKFIISFEKLTEEENINNSKKYGNIAKRLTKEILENDLGGVDLENKRKYTNNEILNFVKSRPHLFKKFKEIYNEMSKRNFWKLQMPLISLKFDFLLDRCNNDYERFKKIYKFFIQKKPIEIKDISKNKKRKLKIDEINDKYEIAEIEKVFYILLNKIKRKKDGKQFLSKYKISITNPFKEN